MELESITGAAVEEKAVPPFFRELMRRGCLDAGEIRAASDGFYAAAKSLADILVGQGIMTFLNDRDELRDCDKFYDDWYCYAVPRQGGYVYSLFKLREQEFDAKNGLIADGDTPGVTVSFIAFDTEVLAQCLSEPTMANRIRLNQEINRVVAARGQRHDKTLKAYFLSPKAEGSYLIAELYVRHIASFAGDGCIDVPEHYASVYRKSAAAGFHGWAGRIPRFNLSNCSSKVNGFFKSIKSLLNVKKLSTSLSLVPNAKKASGNSVTYSIFKKPRNCNSFYYFHHQKRALPNQANTQS